MEECFQAESGGRDGKEVHRHRRADVVGQEGAPGLRRWFAVPRPSHVLGHGGFGDLMAQQSQFGLDTRRPGRVFAGHAGDEDADVLVLRRTPHPLMARFPTPVSIRVARGALRSGADLPPQQLTRDAERETSRPFLRILPRLFVPFDDQSPPLHSARESGQKWPQRPPFPRRAAHLSARSLFPSASGGDSQMEPDGTKWNCL